MNTLDDKGPRSELCGYTFSYSVPFVSYVAQFNHLTAIIQVTGTKLTGIEIYSIRWKLSNAQWVVFHRAKFTTCLTYLCTCRYKHTDKPTWPTKQISAVSAASDSSLSFYEL